MLPQDKFPTPSQAPVTSACCLQPSPLSHLTLCSSNAELPTYHLGAVICYCCSLCLQGSSHPPPITSLSPSLEPSCFSLSFQGPPLSSLERLQSPCVCSYCSTYHEIFCLLYVSTTSLGVLLRDYVFFYHY